MHREDTAQGKGKTVPEWFQSHLRVGYHMQVGDRHMADDTKQAFWYAALFLMQLRQGPLVGPEGDEHIQYQNFEAWKLAVGAEEDDVYVQNINIEMKRRACQHEWEGSNHPRSSQLEAKSIVNKR